jgi:hypothetical protein
MSHIDLTTLIDYWATALSAEGEAAVEEHAFECDDCSRRLNAIGQLAGGVAQAISRHGGMEIIATTSLVDELERDGVVIRRYEAKLGDRVLCTVGALDDLVVTFIKADLRPHERIGFRVVASGDRILTEDDDLPIDRATNSLVYTLSGDLARSEQFADYVRGAPRPSSGTEEVLLLTAKFFAIEPAGERPLGEVVFAHTRFST